MCNCRTNSFGLLLARLSDTSKLPTSNMILVLGNVSFCFDGVGANIRKLHFRFVLAVGRLELLKINLRGVNMAEDVILEEIAKNMDGYSGADITNVCRSVCVT